MKARTMRFKNGFGWGFGMVALGAMLAVAMPAWATVKGPYTTDANTLHLYHFDETDGNNTVTVVPTFVNTGSGTTYSLANNRGVDGVSAFSGFGTAFDVEAGGVTQTANQINNGRAATSASAGGQSLWQGATGAFTYELLVSVSSITSGYSQYLLCRDGADGVRGWALQINATGQLSFDNGFWTTPGSSLVVSIPTTGPHAFVADEWFHVAVSYNGAENTAGNVSLYWTRLDTQYVTANLIGTGKLTADATASSGNYFGVGAFTRNPWRLQALGKVDEVRISNRVRAANEFVFTASPVINNDAPTAITATSAFMNGTLTASGTSDAQVYLFWGPSDGGTTPSAWAHTNYFGSIDINAGPVSFSTNITTLSSGTLYYYTYYATNATEATWATPSKSVINGGVGILKTSDASEIGFVPGTFTVYRASTATNSALTLNYAKTSGTAVSGVNYAALTGAVIIPAGATNAPIVITPIADWVNQGDTTLELTLVGAGLFDAASNATLTISNQTLPGSPTNVWIAAANGNASVPANWSLNHAPTSSETALLGAYSVRALTWDAAAGATVGAWVQESGYTNNVTIPTTYPSYSTAFTNFTVVGNMTVNGGKVASADNYDAENYRLRLTVGGNLEIGAAGTIDVSDLGYDSVERGGVGGFGPGGGGQGDGNSPDNQGGGHGGLGGVSLRTVATITSETYGSILEPTCLGSGGMNYFGGSGNGGGTIYLNVAGSTTVNNPNGALKAGSRDTRDGSLAGGAAGGSVYLRTANLNGSGRISADGGHGDFGAGGGGRVAVVLTAASSVGGSVSITAFGGTAREGIDGAAGTVYVQTTANAPGAGVIYADNTNRGTHPLVNTTLPQTLTAYGSDNLAGSQWIVKNRTQLALAADAQVNSLRLEGNDASLKLAGRTLKLRTFTDKDGVEVTYGRFTDNASGKFDNVNFSVVGSAIELPASGGTVILLR